MIFGKHINKFYLRYFLNFFIGILFLVLIDVIQLRVPEIIANLTLANDMGALTSKLIQESSMQIIIIGIIMFAGRFIWRIAILGGSHHIASDLREEMFEKSEQLSRRFYHENKVGSLMAYFTNDLDTIQESFGWGTVMLVDSMFLSILSFYKMLKVNVKLTLICAIPLLGLCIFAYFVDVKIGKIYEERQNAFELMSEYTQEIFTGLRVIKAFVREKREAARFKKVNDNNKKKDIKLVKYSTFLDTGFEILIEGMVVLGLTCGAIFIYQYVFEGGTEFVRADMIEFNGYFNTIVWPMIALGQIVALRSRAKTSLRRISGLLDEKVELKDNHIDEIKKVNGSITFNNFSYHYPDNDKLVLNDITLKIKSGENVGIVGKIGSGKSTLISSLLRLDNYEKGQIFIDGVDIMSLPIKFVRDNIAYVPQDNFLFSTSIEENVSFSKDELNEDEIIEACEFADVHNNIVEFVEMYKTLVGERGTTLSGGQKQRISIARAYIKKSPIMILDDSLSAVDVKTEEKILANIKNKRKNMTTIVVASRVSTVKDMDRIIVLNDGHIEAFDTHENLLKCSKTYKRMSELQRLESEANSYHG